MQAEKLYTERIGEKEFRRRAGLCELCGQERAETGSNLGEGCNQKIEIRAMEQQWREWGIAA